MATIKGAAKKGFGAAKKDAERRGFDTSKLIHETFYGRTPAYRQQRPTRAFVKDAMDKSGVYVSPPVQKLVRTRVYQRFTQFVREGEERKLQQHDSAYARYVRARQELLRYPKEMYVKAGVAGLAAFLAEAPVEFRGKQELMTTLSVMMGAWALKDSATVYKQRQILLKNLMIARRTKEGEIRDLKKQLIRLEKRFAKEMPAQDGAYSSSAWNRKQQAIANNFSRKLEDYQNAVETSSWLLTHELMVTSPYQNKMKEEKRPAIMKHRVPGVIIEKEAAEIVGNPAKLMKLYISRNPKYAQSLVDLMSGIASGRARTPYPPAISAAAKQVVELGRKMNITPQREALPNEYLESLLRSQHIWQGQQPEGVMSRVMMRTITDLGARVK